jgi:hypothetical protein
VLSFVGAQLGTDTFCLAALVCLSAALTPNPFGNYSDEGFTWMLVAIALLVAAMFAPRRESSSFVWAVMVGAFGLGTAFYSGDAAWAVAAFAAAAVLAAPKRWAWMLLAAAGAAAFLPLGRVWTWGSADIDVFGAVQAGAAALVQGQNPYAATFPVGIYTDPFTFHWVQSHFGYGPVVPFITAPGAFAGDVRIMNVAMFIVLFAAIIGLAANHLDKRRQWWLVAICVAFPLTATMVLHAWTDIYTVGLFALWAALRRRHSLLASFALGVSFAAKFTIIPTLIPFWLWSSKVRREGAIAVMVATAIALPFAFATGLGDFLYDTIGQYVDLPTRFDGMTVNAYLYHQGQGPIGGWVDLLAVVVVAGLILWRKPRDLGDAFVSAGLLMTATLFFAKHAPINYYFIPITLLLLALASRGLPLDLPENVHLPLFAGRTRGLTQDYGRRLVGAGVGGRPTFTGSSPLRAGVVPRFWRSRLTDRSRVEIALSTVEVAPSSATEGTDPAKPPTPTLGAAATPADSSDPSSRLPAGAGAGLTKTD